MGCCCRGRKDTIPGLSNLNTFKSRRPFQMTGCLGSLVICERLVFRVLGLFGWTRQPASFTNEWGSFYWKKVCVPGGRWGSGRFLRKPFAPHSTTRPTFEFPLAREDERVESVGGTSAGCSSHLFARQLWLEGLHNAKQPEYREIRSGSFAR